MRRTIVSGTVVFILIALAWGCVEKESPVGEREPLPWEEKAGEIPISRVLEGADSLRGAEVTVSGEVTAGLAFEFVDEQPYLIDDGTGEVWVITRGLAPEEGSRVTVTGTIRAPYQIKGRRYEVAILETGRSR